MMPTMAASLTDAQEENSWAKSRNDGAWRKWIASLFSTSSREEMTM
jgi:hypothetical protein